MRVAVVAGPDPGHAFPAIALCRRFLAAGDTPTLFTGTERLDTARGAGVDAVELGGLDPIAADDDTDAGEKIHKRAARMAVLNVPRLRDLAPDLVVSDVITACGGLAAELMGLPWIELNPHPLYRPSKGLSPLGSGLAPGVGVREPAEYAQRGGLPCAVGTDEPGDRPRVAAEADVVNDRPPAVALGEVV